MEDMHMKIVKLHIDRLYNHYSYENIEFNTDVTFLYGKNGCGKTTILNIIEAIITGQIYKLFDFTFSSIDLFYASNEDLDKLHRISILYRENNLEINFKGDTHRMSSRVKIPADKRAGERHAVEKIRYYFSEYPVLTQIKNTFNYVYLPLNRSSHPYEFIDDDYIAMRHNRDRQRYRISPFDEPSNRDYAMIQIETLISESCNQINSKVSKISDDFRNNILKSLLDISNNNVNTDKIFKNFFGDTALIEKITKTKEAYIKILKELSIISQKEEEDFVSFFKSLIEDIQNGSVDNTMQLFLQFNEVQRMQKLVSLAEKNEKEKAEERKPLELFVNTMNEFINTNEEEKKIEVDSFGHVFFTTRDNQNPISIQFLSSGEKQLITFFANLIFKVKDTSSGIFVVDEPELSLHLSWQKIFVSKTLEINKNIQLIFATHAPEIIGNRRNKAFKLDKRYINNHRS